MSKENKEKEVKESEQKSKLCPKGACGKLQPKQMAGIIVTVLILVVVTVSLLTKNGSAEGQKEKATQVRADATLDANPAVGSDVKLGDPVVAVVGGQNILRSDVFAFISGLPEQVRQMPIQTLFPLALEQVVNNHVVTMRANLLDLSEDQEVQKLFSEAKEQIIRNVFVERQIESDLTQKRLLEAYGKLLDTVADIKEVRARHILVEDESVAKELIKQLDNGADFEALAKEKSTGPSAGRGGDLGFFAENEMVEEFSKAAFSMEAGAHSKEPVQTQFGWHVIKVEEKRTRPEPQFEDVKPQIEAELRQQILAELIEKWQTEANIRKFDINGETAKEVKQP
jgi:peptidyl-prolyl cis-trans isomerase C